MNHVITTYGGGELFNLVFNGIAALFNTNQGLLLPLMRVGLTIGLVYVVLVMFFRSQVMEGFKWFLWAIIATNLIFLPKTMIYIHDPLANQKYKVDNVPFALGAFASLVSQIGTSVTEKFESVFTLPNYMPYHETGTVFASALMHQVGKFRIVDPIFKGNIDRFVNQCVVYDALIGQKYTLKDLQNTPDLWKLVMENASPVLGFLYKQVDEPGRVITCKEGALKLNALWSQEIKKAMTIYGNRINNKNLTEATFKTHLQNGFQLMAGIAEDATTLLRQEMMINATHDSSNNKLSELGSPSNYAATKALLQQRSAYEIAGDIAARTLPLFKNVIEAFSYTLFIFVVMLALLPNGYKILMTYCGILVWTQLWAPLYAVLNLIMTLYGKSETLAQGADKGITLLNSSALYYAHADMMTLAAWFSVSIPFISYGILKQGAGAFVGLAHHLGSAMQQASSAAASEAVSGNLSLGNISMGTQAYQNTSAFQHNTSPSYTSSHFKGMNASGIEQSTFADGTQSLTSQALSRLSVQIMGSENTSHALQESFNEAKSLFQSKSIAAGEAAESAFQTTLSYLSHVSQNLMKGEDYKKNITATDAETLQNFKSFVSDLRQSTGMTENQAVEAAIGFTLALPGGIGPNANTNFSNSAARQKGIEVAKSLATQKNYTDSLEKIVSASKDLSESESFSRGKDMSDSTLASLNKAKSLREEASIAQNRIETLSKDISSGHSESMTITRDLTQDILEFIATQPTNPGPTGIKSGSIGYETARKILENGSRERETYLERFNEENPQFSIQSINSSQGETQMRGHYNTESQALKRGTGIEAHSKESILNLESHKELASDTDLAQRVIKEGSEKEIVQATPQQDNLRTQSPITSPATTYSQLDVEILAKQPAHQSVKQYVTSRLETRNKDIEKQKKEINNHEEFLKKAEKEANEKTLAGTVLNNSIPDSIKSLDLQTLHGHPWSYN